MLLSSLEESLHLINFTRWGEYLPDKYKISLIEEKLYDFDGAFESIDKIQVHIKPKFSLYSFVLD